MKELKFIHAADLHLDSRFDTLPEKAAEKRREGQRELLFNIAGLAEEYGALAVLLSGDVFESDAASKESQEAFIRAFSTLNMPVFVSPGNHDPYTPSSIWARMRLPGNVCIFKNEAIEHVDLPDLQLRVWGAGFEHTFSGSLLEGFMVPEKRKGITDVMLIHGELTAGESSYNAISRQQIASSGMDYIALGHIHKCSELDKVNGTAFAYPGCAEGRGYDETGPKGALLVSICEGNVKTEFLPLGGARYEIIRVDISGTDPLEKIRQETLEYTGKDHCRIILSGECEELPDIPAIRRSLEGRFADLQLRDETILKLDVWEQLGQNSLAGVFLQRLRTAFDSSASAEESKLIELAARYGLTSMESGGGK